MTDFSLLDEIRSHLCNVLLWLSLPFESICSYCWSSFLYHQHYLWMNKQCVRVWESPPPRCELFGLCVWLVWLLFSSCSCSSSFVCVCVCVCVCVFTDCVLHSVCDRREDAPARSCSTRSRLPRAGQVGLSTFTSSLSALLCSLVLLSCLLSYWGAVETQSFSCLHLDGGQALTCTQTRGKVKTRGLFGWGNVRWWKEITTGDVPTEEVALLRRDFPHELQPPQPFSFSWSDFCTKTNTQIKNVI